MEFLGVSLYHQYTCIILTGVGVPVRVQNMNKVDQSIIILIRLLYQKITECKSLPFDRKTWNYIIIVKLFVFQRTAWHHITAGKIFELDNIKQYNCIQIICNR